MASPMTERSTRSTNRELDRAMAQGRIRSYSYLPTVPGVRYRKWNLILAGGARRSYTARQVAAFLDGLFGTEGESR